MFLKRQEFKIQDKVILGNPVFIPPFKASSALQVEARFVHIIHGKSTLYSPNGQVELQTGDSLVMKCENFVNSWSANENNEPSEVVIFQLFPETLKHVYNNNTPDFLNPKKGLRANAVEKVDQNDMISHYVAGLRYYLDNPEFITEDFLKIKIQELLFVLANTDKTGKIKAILSNLFRSNEYEFKEIVHSHLYDDLNLEDLAFFAGLSLSSFKRKFKSIFGTSPNQYIKTKRLEKAQQLLVTSSHRISEIAYDCGFNDTGYFSKSFMSVYNCSPSDFRKRHVN